MKQLLSALVVAFVLATLIFSGCSQLTDEPSDGWNTYTNEEYGYSFGYPSDCTFGPMPPNCKSKPPEERPPECLCFLDSPNPDQVFMQAFLGDENALTLAGFNVNHNDSPVFNPPHGKELTAWLESEFSQMHAEIPDEPNFEIDGIPAVRIYTPGSPMAPSYEDIYFLLEGKLFNIKMLDIDNQDNMQLYEHILESFQIAG